MPDTSSKMASDRELDLHCYIDYLPVELVLGSGIRWSLNPENIARCPRYYGVHV